MQRLGLAQAMLHDPDLLILDEPTDGVDPVGRAQIREILGRLKAQGKTIFLNSHLLQEVELICDRVAILGRGRMRRLDTIEGIRRLTSPEAVFTVHADDASARRILDGRVISTEPLEEGKLRILVDAPTQESLDRAIDALRHGGLSIASVMRKQLTLEQAFLDLILEDGSSR